jgi:hypothetical protein
MLEGVRPSIYPYLGVLKRQRDKSEQKGEDIMGKKLVNPAGVPRAEGETNERTRYQPNPRREER